MKGRSSTKIQIICNASMCVDGAGLDVHTVLLLVVTEVPLVWL